MQHSVEALESRRWQQTTEQWVSCRGDTHLAGQQTAKMLQSVAIPPGVGKTMLAVALGRKSIDAGYRTYCTTAADLAAKCHRAALEGRWATTMRFFAGPRLLIIDEVGYLPLASEAAAALFQVITQRYLKGSICLTTNLPFEKAHTFERTCARWHLKFTGSDCRPGGPRSHRR
jgi:hypothetical protein